MGRNRRAGFDLGRWLGCGIVATLAGVLGAGEAAAVDFEGIAATVVGYVLARSVHDTGQGVTAKGLGWTVTDFRPYPTTCRGHFALSCVSYHPVANIDFTDQEEIRRFHDEDALIIGSGALATHVAMAIGAPLLGGKAGTGFWARTGMSAMATMFIDTPLTTIAAGLGSTTEWTQLADDKHIKYPQLIGVGVADFLGVGYYASQFGVRMPFFSAARQHSAAIVDGHVNAKSERPQVVQTFDWQPLLTARADGSSAFGVRGTWRWL